MPQPSQQSSQQSSQRIAVLGAGPMGLMNAQVARFNGASEVAIIDINESRLERARRDFGFSTIATRL